MSHAKLILAECESPNDVFFFHCQNEIRELTVDMLPIQHQRRIGAAVVLREMAAEIRKAAPTTPMSWRKRDLAAATRLEARAQELESQS